MQNQTDTTFGSKDYWDSASAGLFFPTAISGILSPLFLSDQFLNNFAAQAPFGDMNTLAARCIMFPVAMACTAAAGYASAKLVDATVGWLDPTHRRLRQLACVGSAYAGSMLMASTTAVAPSALSAWQENKEHTIHAETPVATRAAQKKNSVDFVNYTTPAI